MTHRIVVTKNGAPCPFKIGMLTINAGPRLGTSTVISILQNNDKLDIRGTTMSSMSIEMRSASCASSHPSCIVMPAKCETSAMVMSAPCAHAWTLVSHKSSIIRCTICASKTTT